MKKGFLGLLVIMVLAVAFFVAGQSQGKDAATGSEKASTVDTANILFRIWDGKVLAHKFPGLSLSGQGMKGINGKDVPANWSEDFDIPNYHCWCEPYSRFVPFLNSDPIYYDYYGHNVRLMGVYLSGVSDKWERKHEFVEWPPRMMGVLVQDTQDMTYVIRLSYVNAVKDGYVYELYDLADKK